MIKIFKTIFAFLALAMMTYSPASSSQSQQDGKGAGRPGGGPPPKEAMKACDGKSIGDKVQFKTRRGKTIAAVCKLIAVPERGQRPRRQNSDSENSNRQRPPRQSQEQ